MAKSQGIAEQLRKAVIRLCWCLVFATHACFASTSVSILFPERNSTYNKVVDAITSGITGDTSRTISYQTHTLAENGVENREEILHAEIIISVGARATHQALLQFPDKQIIASFITKSALNKLQQDYPNRIVGAVLLDQPATRLLRLTRLIDPGLSELGLLTGPQSRKRIPEFINTGKTLGINLNTAQLIAGQNPVKSLETIMATSQGYLVLPDKSDFNRQTAKWIIYLSYRYRIPVIGYSSRYVDAGALLSIYSTPQQIGVQTNQLIIKRITGEDKALGVHYPHHFVIRLNNKVKRTLGFPNLEVNTLTKQLMAMEKAPYNPEQQDAKPKTE